LAWRLVTQRFNVRRPSALKQVSNAGDDSDEDE